MNAPFPHREADASPLLAAHPSEARIAREMEAHPGLGRMQAINALRCRDVAEDRARRRQDYYSPLYGHPTGCVSNPVTGSMLAHYANGMSFEVALPCCDHCDDLLDDHGYCPACEVRSDSFGLDEDWTAIGRSLNAMEADRDRANAAIDASLARARGRAA